MALGVEGVRVGVRAADCIHDPRAAPLRLTSHAPRLAMLASLPAVVKRTIAQAKAVSETTSGKEEAETLRRITVNTGRIEGGIGVSTIPDRARALCDIRIPPGVTVDRVGAVLASASIRAPTCRGGSSNARSRAGPIRRRRSCVWSARTRRRSPDGMWW